VLILILLFITNTTVVLRERFASNQASASLERVQSLEAAQLKMMQVRLYLQDYLLTGDTRQADKLSQETAALAELFTQGRARAQSDMLREVLSRMESNERDWLDKLARPMIAQRKRVDAGDATAADLQVFYAQQDPNAWTTTS